MICSSVNRFFMLPPLRQTLIQFRTILGEQVTCNNRNSWCAIISTLRQICCVTVAKTAHFFVQAPGTLRKREVTRGFPPSELQPTLMASLIAGKHLLSTLEFTFYPEKLR